LIPICEVYMRPFEPVSQATIDSLIWDVDKPARYTGGEVNSVVKPDPVRARLALCFPDVYEVAESHLGFKILYEIVNDRPDFAAERVYALWPDLEHRLRAAKIPLWSLESRRPLAAFDVVGFTLQYELCYPTVLAMLDLGGIPIRTAMRAEADPIVVGGGICAFNPEPLAPFFDALLLGDGEEAVLQILDAVARCREAKASRAEILVALAGIEGVYVPSHFDIQYDGLAVTKLEALPATPHTDHESMHHTPRVKRASVADLDQTKFTTRPIVPNVQPVHERVAVEIQRGCSRACRFCQPGFVTRPTRQRRAETVQTLAAAGLAASGCDAVGFLSLSAGDYQPINEVVSGVLARHQKDRVQVSLPSLRSETMTPELAERLTRSAASGFTFAPEAGSERLRRVINKSSSNADLLNAVNTTVQRGWRNLKFYFMIGLPTETQVDLDAILALAIEARQQARAARQDANVTVAVSTFVPKPHTPFQWESQISIDDTRARQRFLREALRKHRIILRYHSPEQSFVEGVLSRGDRRLAGAIEALAVAGCRLDAWTELYDHARWLKALRDVLTPHGLVADDYLKTRAIDATLPWDHLDAGVLKKFLKRDRQSAYAELAVGDCAFGVDCYACGACDLADPHLDRRQIRDRVALEPRVFEASATPPPFPPNADLTQRTPRTAPAKSKLRFRFEKAGRAVHLSQLDTLNQVVRAIRQSGLPVMYTEGHVPRPRVGFSPACPTGIESRAEYFEADCAGFPDPEAYTTKLNRLLPDGLQVIEGKEIPFDTPSFNELIRNTTYAVTPVAEVDLTAALAMFAAAEMRCVRVTRKAKPRLLDAKACVTKAEVRGRELVLSLGFSRFGTIKIGEAVAAVLGRAAAHGARIRKEEAEIGTEPLSHEAPDKLVAHGEVLDLTDLSERRTPEAASERGEAHVPYTES
jgi:radical SAM family uncharacterized protein/radical SAM-linked protein